MLGNYLSFLLILGLLILLVTLGSKWIARLPVSYALIYLIVGILLGSEGFDILQTQPSTAFIERLTEFVVIVSVFGCGLKMNRPLNPAYWQITGRLIGILMPISIAATAAISHWLFEFDWGPAILLGAIAAPTDPVLASEVQLDHLQDRDELRFSLTSEGGLNDSLAFPFVYFGLYWIQKGHPDNWFQKWVLVDLLWAIAAGIVMGMIVALVIHWMVRQLQRHQPIEDLMEDLVALGIILLAYALTEMVNGYGFLAVFVAGLTLGSRYPKKSDQRLALIAVVEQFEKLLEIFVILLLGSLLSIEPLLEYGSQAGVLALMLLIMVRPLGGWISLLGSGLPNQTRWLFGWFGIRGVGSLYYLSYALGKGVGQQVAEPLTWTIYIIVVTSIVLHGVSTSPLMGWYHHKIETPANQGSE